jgi:hypothetical protein
MAGMQICSVPLACTYAVFQHTSCWFVDSILISQWPACGAAAAGRILLPATSLLMCLLMMTTVLCCGNQWGGSTAAMTAVPHDAAAAEEAAALHHGTIAINICTLELQHAGAASCTSQASQRLMLAPPWSRHPGGPQQPQPVQCRQSSASQSCLAAPAAVVGEHLEHGTMPLACLPGPAAPRLHRSNTAINQAASTPAMHSQLMAKLVTHGPGNPPPLAAHSNCGSLLANSRNTAQHSTLHAATHWNTSAQL